MSRDLGAELPEALQTRLDGRNLRPLMGRAHLVVTVDGRGRPHPAMLSYGELLATGPREIRLATYRDSTTARNMRGNGHLTLCLVDSGMAYYVKGRVEELTAPGDFPKLARFRMTVDQVLEDATQADVEGEARILTGITFGVRGDAERWLRDWERLIRTLPWP